jgi:LysM repeat protein
VKEKEDEKVLPKAAAPRQNIKTKPAVIIHRVKKGDNLDKIARKYRTSVTSLLRLNRMKMRDPLYVDRELKVAGQTA